MATRYTPKPTEPSLFTGTVGELSKKWQGWIRGESINGPDSGKPYGSEYDHMVFRISGYGILAAIKASLLEDDSPLPDEPPPIKTLVNNDVSMIWVMDTCRREKMPPEEAYVLGLALLKM